MRRVLIVYATKSGCTKGVAGKIASTIARPGVKIKIAEATDAPDPANYDAVLVGSGIRAGRWHEPARAWVVANAETLKTKQIAFFTVSILVTKGADKIAVVRRFTDALIAETGVHPFDVGVFAGWNKPEHFSLVDRVAMRLMNAPRGDQRDWMAIEEWARAAGSIVAA
ncbi:MAG: flavodoxin domain-containing protein [Coriobacteriia bacterium]|nr:flavodoxin domain-containing protein [Coriobacteriia bacterium]